MSRSSEKKASTNLVRPARTVTLLLYKYVGTRPRDKKGLTVQCSVTDGVRPILLLLGLALVLPKLSRPVPQDGVALGEDAAVELDDGNRAERVVVEELRSLPFGVLLEGVADVFICDAGILEP